MRFWVMEQKQNWHSIGPYPSPHYSKGELTHQTKYPKKSRTPSSLHIPAMFKSLFSTTICSLWMSLTSRSDCLCISKAFNFFKINISVFAKGHQSAIVHQQKAWALREWNFPPTIKNHELSVVEFPIWHFPSPFFYQFPHDFLLSVSHKVLYLIKMLLKVFIVILLFSHATNPDWYQAIFVLKTVYIFQSESLI